MKRLLLALCSVFPLSLACGGGTKPADYEGHEPHADADGNTVLSTPGFGLRMIAVDDSDVFFVTGTTDDTVLWAVPREGGPTRKLGDPGHNVEALIPQGDWVYTATWDAIYRFHKQTGEYERVSRYAGKRIEIKGMAMRGEDIVFGSYEGALYRVPVIGEKPELIAQIADKKVHNWSLTIDGDHVYYAFTNQIGRIPLAGGEPESLATEGLPTARSPLVVQGDHLYLDDSVTEVRHLSLTDNTLSRVACKCKDHIWGMAIDGDDLYLGAGVGKANHELRDRNRGGGAVTEQVYVKSNAGDGEGGLMHCRLNADAAEMTNLAPAAKTVVAIALDPTHVYWADSDLGMVLRRAR